MKRGFAHILIIVLVVGLACLFLPVPHYVGKVICQVNTECPQNYWSIGPSIAEEILSGLRQPSGGATETACTLEAKICPDGSSVGRTGPNCEFAQCPSSTTGPTNISRQSENTYVSDAFHFSFSYLPGWKVYAQEYKEGAVGGTINLKTSDLSPQGVTNKLYYRFNIFKKEGSFERTVTKYAGQCETDCSEEKLNQKINLPIINVGGHKAYKQGLGDEVYIDGGDYVIIIVGTWDKMLLGSSEQSYATTYQYTGNMLEEVLSTFKFTN